MTVVKKSRHGFREKGACDSFQTKDLNCMSTPLDFTNVPEEAVKELHRQAETCLGGTVQLAIAADLRATTMAGIFGAGCVALLAAIATVLASNVPYYPFVGGAASMAFCLFVAALASGMAATPTDFHVGGYEPKLFIPSATDVVWMLRYAIDDMQVRIDLNRTVLERSAGRLRVGMAFAVLAIPLGIIVFSALRAGLRSS
jgi:hypothetical protein